MGRKRRTQNRLLDFNTCRQFLSLKAANDKCPTYSWLRILVTYISSDVGRDYWEEIKYLYMILKHQTLGPNDHGEDLLIIFDLLLAAFILPKLFHTPVSALRCMAMLIWRSKARKGGSLFYSFFSNGITIH
jgi:hypothetical protein